MVWITGISNLRTVRVNGVEALGVKGTYVFLQ